MATRIFEYRIPYEYRDRKVYEFLRGKGFSHQNLTDIRFKDYPILVNGNRVYRNHVLNDDDRLVVEYREEDNSENIPPVELPLDIIYEDEDVLVVNKPSDMPIHPSLNNYDNSLGNAVMYYYNSQNVNFVYRCINRLDRDTTGPVIVAKNSVSANILGRQQLRHEIHKKYYAIVEGEDIADADTVNLPIGRADGSTIERRVDFENGKNAVTHFRTIRRENGFALVELWLDTGRTHQIRVHMKAIGHPLAGDFLYNPTEKSLQRQALHVHWIEFIHPFDGRIVTVEAPMPEDMRKIMSL